MQATEPVGHITAPGQPQFVAAEAVGTVAVAAEVVETVAAAAAGYLERRFAAAAGYLERRFAGIVDSGRCRRRIGGRTKQRYRKKCLG